MGEAQLNVQQLCNLMWSLAIAEECDQELWDACLEQVGLGDP